MYLIHSNRTLTAKFVQGKTFNFIVNGDGWLEWWDGRGDAFSITFTRDELDNSQSHRISPIPNYGWELSGDEWDVNGNSFLADQNADLFITQRIYDTYPDNTTFCYSFMDPSQKTVTINILSRTWQSNKWLEQAGGMVGFSSIPTLIADKKTVKYNETVTVYAKGKEGNDDSDYGTETLWYYVAGFYNSAHSAYKVNSGINVLESSYTFKAKNDITIYVDFQFYKK